jgi:DNA repair protein SbcC/Rad50
MHITRVELENIKSYEHAEYTFERGTTAIVGRNGAGKTTILEAVAWALFDTLEYSKEDFTRRGQKKGSVNVTFTSDLDGRQYTVYRDTGNGYHIYDPVLGARIAERKTDVTAFIYQHLGIEPGTDLKALFRSAIGVPQGLFTADFLETAARRKPSFDKLLKVEEYRQSADRLRDTVKLIAERTTEVRERIAGAEGRLERYDSLVEEHNAASKRERELENRARELQTEISTRASVVEKLDEAERAVRDSLVRRDRLTIEMEAAARRLADFQIEIKAAEQAVERQNKTRGNYQLHARTLQELTRLDELRHERDRLSKQSELTTRKIISAEERLSRLDDALASIERAHTMLAELEPAILEQIDLEKERERLRDLKARAEAARDRLIRLDRELEDLRAQLLNTRERVRQTETLRGAQKQVEDLESERIDVENKLVRAREDNLKRKHLMKQRDEQLRDVERFRRTVRTLEAELQGFEEQTTAAREGDALEARERELTNQAAHLRAEIARDERMRAETKNGLCPILSERCLNIGPDQTLDSYFTDQLAHNRAQLARLEKEHAQAISQVARARAAHSVLARAEAVRARLAHDRELLDEREELLARTDEELTAVSANYNSGYEQELKNQIIGIDGELKAAREDAKKYGELPLLGARLKEIEAEGKHKKEERGELEAAANGINALAEEAETVELRLRALNDPRGRAVAFRSEIEREAEIKNETKKANDALANLRAQAREIEIDLQRFAGLDAQWSEAIKQRDETAEDYREYLASEREAASLPARRQSVEAATAEVERLRVEHERALQMYEGAIAAYDHERHDAERGRFALAREDAAATNAQLNVSRERSESLAAEIAQLDEIRSKLKDEFAARARLESLHEATDFVRETLKRAGPLVTESYLYNVSIEANLLFREITGDTGRSLRWSRDYEIILEEGGHERSFPNLSGGEQMAAALAVRLALLKQLSDIRVAFFDEPTVNMDAERRARLAESIGRVRHFDQLFVISHDDTFEETVEHVVTVGEQPRAEQTA